MSIHMVYALKSLLTMLTLCYLYPNICLIWLNFLSYVWISSHVEYSHTPTLTSSQLEYLCVNILTQQFMHIISWFTHHFSFAHTNMAPLQQNSIKRFQLLSSVKQQFPATFLLFLYCYCGSSDSLDFTVCNSLKTCQQ